MQQTLDNDTREMVNEYIQSKKLLEQRLKEINSYSHYRQFELLKEMTWDLDFAIDRMIFQVVDTMCLIV